MYAAAPAKINLGLRIVSKQTNGYHTISSIFLPIALVDIVEIVPSSTSEMHISGLPIPDSQENIITKLLRLLQHNGQLKQNLSVHLHKQIPVGAGLGGGSSDLVSALALLNPLLEKPLDEQSKFLIATKMGSDCPFFLTKKPQLVSGIGDLLEEIKMPNMEQYVILLIYPNLHIDTTQAYNIYDRQLAKQAVSSAYQQTTPLASLLTKPVSAWKHHFINDFERSIFDTYTQLAQIKQQFYASGAVYASMSGSGSTIYAFYEKEKVDKTSVKHHFQQIFPDFATWLFCWTDFYY